MTKQDFCGRLGCGCREGEAGFSTNINISLTQKLGHSREASAALPNKGHFARTIHRYKLLDCRQHRRHCAQSGTWECIIRTAVTMLPH